ncbi:MAG: DUF4399 domain-containing protein [Lysobacteraceae bacterium]
MSISSIRPSFFSLLAGLLGMAALAAWAADPAPGIERRAAAEGAELYIITPTDGETISSPVTVRFGLRGMGVTPAGSDLPHTGHHHLLVDVAELPNAAMPIPADERHIHFGKGQTETTIELVPGEHTLQLLLGDFRHMPHDPIVVSERITITVAP